MQLISRVNEILVFWFEGVDDAVRIDKNKAPFKKWFIKSPSLDEEIRVRFQQDLAHAARGRYQEWEATAEGKLALIILLDQFSRNMYRDTPKMYGFDGQAQKLTLAMLAQNEQGNLPLIQRIFACMPLMHAEDAELQKLSVRCFEQLAAESQSKKPDNSHYYQYNLEYARKHGAIVERFGRFPHRNAILGRASSEEELAFLKEKGSSF